SNLQEHTIAEKDFKNLYPSDFEDLNLLIMQGHLDNLLGSEKHQDEGQARPNPSKHDEGHAISNTGDATEERLATPEPAWTIPSSNMSDVENN
nr:hypothetical protein [Tanacetum cinerariifolium]